jgi:hypothetical protein
MVMVIFRSGNRVGALPEWPLIAIRSDMGGLGGRTDVEVIQAPDRRSWGFLWHFDSNKLCGT